MIDAINEGLDEIEKNIIAQEEIDLSEFKKYKPPLIDILSKPDGKNEYALFVKFDELDLEAFLHCNDLT